MLTWHSVRVSKTGTEESAKISSMLHHVIIIRGKFYFRDLRCSSLECELLKPVLTPCRTVLTPCQCAGEMATFSSFHSLHGIPKFFVIFIVLLVLLVVLPFPPSCSCSSCSCSCFFSSCSSSHSASFPISLPCNKWSFPRDLP